MRVASSGLGRMAGYAISMVLLAVASLSLIPALIRAGGAAGWGAIALGQAIGALAAVVIAYGWGLAGPARIATQQPAERRTEFIESLRVRIVLFPVAAAAASSIAMLTAPAHSWLAACGAVAAASVGLTANWYFVGVRRPYTLLLVETGPRVLGSVAGVLALSAGAPTAAGILLQLAGMLTAFAVSASWVLRTLPRDAGSNPRPLGSLLITGRHGLASTLASATYVAAPMVIVSLIAPAAQPVYALADKLQRQISIALNPAVTVLQGWVPHTDDRQRRRNAGRAVLLGAALASGCLLAVIGAAPLLIDLLGAGSISVSWPVIGLMALFVGFNLYESILAKAVLAALDRLKPLARITTVSSVVGLVLVAIGAMQWSVIGALAGAVTGLLIRVPVELVIARSAIRSKQTAPGPAVVQIPLQEGNRG